MGQDRVQAMPDGTVALEVRHQWTHGTTHVVFEPVELLGRLAALVRRPRVNLVRYHGVLAPRAVVPGAAAPNGAGGRAGRRPNPTWAELMQRSFRLRQGFGGLAEALRAKAVGFDVLACPRCAGRLTLVAVIHAPAVVERILRHLGEPTELPRLRPSRDPPAA